jgi:hypothetical protein
VSTAPPDIRIFVSYRKSDAHKAATKIASKLDKRFGGKTHVFQDVSSIMPGIPWDKAIDDALGSCDVFLVVMGSDWLTASDDKGARRLDDETDRHRREIEVALSREIPVLPVLVDEAVMPRAEDLPGELKTLQKIQAQRLDMYAFEVDVEDLIAVVETAARVHQARTAEAPAAPAEEPEVDEDGRRREEAMELAEQGEFLRALEIAAWIEDSGVRAEVLLAVGQAQVDAGSTRSETQETVARARVASAGIADAGERDRVLADAADVESEMAAETTPSVVPGSFAAAEVITGSAGSVLGGNADATKEPGEPNHAGNVGGRSVWYRWTSTAVGAVTIDTFGSDFDTLLAIYRGSSLDDLVPVASNDDADGSQSRVTFRVAEGEEYRIAVDGYGGATGSIVLSWAVQAPPPNGYFEGAEEITGASGTARGDSTGSSKEPAEPDHAGSTGGSSVWYRWQAPEDGVAIFDTFGSDFDTLLAVYRGSSLALLEHVTSNDDAGRPQSRVTFRVAEGEEYRIAVDGYAGASGAVVLNWAVEDRESLALCLDGAGLRYVEVGDGAVVLRLHGVSGEVVVDAKESDDGVTYFSVDIPEYRGFGARTVLQNLLKLSYGADYVKVMSLAGGGFAVAAEIPSSALTRGVCEGLIWAVVAMGEVREASELRDTSGWAERMGRCTTMLDRYIDVDPERARVELHGLFQGAGLVSGGRSYVLDFGFERRPLAVHMNRRVISLMVSLEDVRPGGDKGKLERLLELNRDVDVAKVGLNSQGDVTLLYEVPQVVPELAEHAPAQLRTLYTRVRAAV